MHKYRTVKSSEIMHKISLLMCSIAPFALIIILELLSFIPFFISKSFLIGSDLALAAVFYWAVYAPARFRLCSAFAAGICSDILFMTPFGSQTLIFVLVFQSITKIRKFILPKTFRVVWLFFMLLSTLSSLLIWIIISLVYQQLCALTPILVNAIISWLCYPVVVLCCNLLLKILQRVRPYE